MARSSSNKTVPGPAAGRTIGIVVVLLLVIVILGLTLLRGTSGQSPPGASVQGADQLVVGQQLYVKQCAICHGMNLEGQPNWQAELPGGGRLAPPHNETGHTWHHADQQLFEITKYGGQRFSPPDYKNNMPGFAERLSDTQIRAILAYIKSTWSADIREAQAKLNQ